MSAASSLEDTDGSALPTTLPRRITVIVSATSRTSCSLWLMNTMEVPPSRSARMTVISSSVSCGVSTAVGSSSTSMRALRLSALRISTRCCTPTGRSATSASGGTSSPYRLEISATWRRALRWLRKPIECCSWPSMTFSVTLKTGISMKCWCTMPMPAAIASPGPLNDTGWSSMRISPSSGWYSPYSTFISVDLPAPFSPSNAWISPGFDDEVDAVVRRERAEAFGDPPEFELHAPTFSSEPARRAGPVPVPPAADDRASCRYAFGWLGEVILILPLMMSALTWSSSLFSDDDTFES